MGTPTAHEIRDKASCCSKDANKIARGLYLLDCLSQGPSGHEYVLKQLIKDRYPPLQERNEFTGEPITW